MNRKGYHSINVQAICNHRGKQIRPLLNLGFSLNQGFLSCEQLARLLLHSAIKSGIGKRKRKQKRKRANIMVRMGNCKVLEILKYNWIILTVVPFGEPGFLPHPVLFREAADLLCSFLAELTIPVHFSFTSATLLLHTSRAFTLEVISSQTRDLFLFDNVKENLLLIILRFSSASSKITAHSAGVKLGFLGRLAGEGSIFSAMLLSVSHAQSKLTQGSIYYHGNCLDSDLSNR